MEGYLGETSSNDRDGWTMEQWILEFIGRYGGIDGAHHKSWVLDQCARLLHGGKVEVKRASWSDGQTELRFSDVSKTPEYEAWVTDMRFDEDGEEYDYDPGIAP